MLPRPATASWLLTLLAITAGGCAIVGNAARREAGDDTPPAGEAALRPAPRTVMVEVLFVRCPAEDQELREGIWDQVDEQAIDDARRRSLNANGLRVGVITGYPPGPLLERLTTAEEPAGDAGGTEAVGTRRRLQLLPGRGSEIVTAARLPSLVLLERHEGTVRGGTYHDATVQLALDAHPAPDGRVRLEAVPEIRHGPVEKSWAGEGGMFRLETGQRRHRMDSLGIDVTLPLDGMLLIGLAGEPSSSVGDGLLREHGTEGGTVRLLVIRPLNRGVDPAFAAAEPAEVEDDVPPLTLH